MRPALRRWRWWGKAMSSIAAIVLALAWFLSGWYAARLSVSPTRTAHAELGIAWGQVVVSWLRPSIDFPAGISWDIEYPPVYSHGYPRPRWYWSFEEGSFTPTGTYPFVRVPMWVVFLLTILPAVWLWHLDRCPRHGHCPRCNYDLSATPSGPCPECGDGQGSCKAN